MKDHVRHSSQTGRRPKPPVAGRRAPRSRGQEIEKRMVMSNLPDQLPILREKTISCVSTSPT